MNLADVATYTSLSTGVVAVLGTIIAKWLEHKTKELSQKISAEASLRAQLMSRIDRLEQRLADAIGREDALRNKVLELETMVRTKEFSLKELQYKHEALLDNHRELSERYKFSERENSKLRDEMLRWYLESDINIRRTLPPPPRYPHDAEG